MSTIDNINQVVNERDALYEKAALQSGLPSLSFRILYTLRYYPNKKFLQSEIADTYFFSRKSVNSAIQVLLKKKLIQLCYIKGEGNRKYLAFTKEGEEFAKEKIDPIVDADNASFLRLSKEEQELFYRLEKKQLDYFKEELMKKNKKGGNQ